MNSARFGFAFELQLDHRDPVTSKSVMAFLAENGSEKRKLLD